MTESNGNTNRVAAPICVVCESEPALRAWPNLNGFVEMDRCLWDINNYHGSASHGVCAGCARSNLEAVYLGDRRRVLRVTR